jgi:D-glycerate 3-kinase
MSPVLPSPLAADDPLALWMLAETRALLAQGRRPMWALNGPVGAGKSSLARQLQQLFRQQGLQLAIASIDDAYLPAAARRQAMAGNPFGVSRVPPGSHDPQALVEAVVHWRAEPWRPEGPSRAPLQLPRFDKTLLGGEGDRIAPWKGTADALLLEGWLLGCRPRPPRDLAEGKAALDGGQHPWLLRCNAALAAYEPLWRLADRWVVLWPQDWCLPRRWRFQAEARQRRGGGGWLAASDLQALVEASLRSLPPALYQEPVLQQAHWVRLLDGRRRCRWQGSGDAWRNRSDRMGPDQASSSCSSATG